MSAFIDINTYPFTKEQIRFFRRELERAGSIDKLLIKKQALKIKDSFRIITECRDMEGYKQKFLTGVYEPLREQFNMVFPVALWLQLHEMLRKVNPKIK